MFLNTPGGGFLYKNAGSDPYTPPDGTYNLTGNVFASGTGRFDSGIVVQGSAAAGTLFNVTSTATTLTASSGVQKFVAVTPTVAQSGTAGYTALLVNVTESSTGSGTCNLVDYQVGGSSKYSVSNTGAITAASINTAGNITFGGFLQMNSVQMGMYGGTSGIAQWYCSVATRTIEFANDLTASSALDSFRFTSRAGTRSVGRLATFGHKATYEELFGIDFDGQVCHPTAISQSTVGAAGAASALPATPTGYLKRKIGATTYVTPYYAAS